ncbi:MAG TPA: serine/threonine-protein kinase [Kofleriaceae bacterium]|nr:serine/threonine-protein kinase [Kofleriaceae bacterium]
MGSGGSSLADTFDESADDIGGRFDRFNTLKDDDAEPTRVHEIPERPLTVSTCEAPARADDAPLTAGTMIGDYRIESVIGSGGMGVVYAATHAMIGKRAAIKVLRRSLCQSERDVSRFVDEARLVNRIGHPNIVDVFAMGVTACGCSYLVMEYLQGETLRERLARSRLDIARSLAIVQPLVQALMAAHEQGVVHRDLKPDNVFIVEGARGIAPTIKLLDFGLAKLAIDQVRVDRTEKGAVIGTPQYIAPEQARGQAIDARADVYGLGCIWFEMLTGLPPFVAANTVELVTKHLLESAARVATQVADVPAEIDDLIARMLAKDPADRPTLAEVDAVVEAASKPRPLPAAIAMPPRRAEADIATEPRRPLPAPAPRRARPLLWLGSVLLFAASGAASFFVTSYYFLP